MIALSRMPPSPRVAVSMIFGIIGFVSAGWIARIPAVTDKLAMDTAQLGALLLFIAVGSLGAFQIVGPLIERHGSDRITGWFAIMFIAAMVLMAKSPIPWVLAIGLLLYGFGFGATDVAMNAQGVTVEHRLGKPIMGTCTDTSASEPWWGRQSAPCWPRLAWAWKST